MRAPELSSTGLYRVRFRLGISAKTGKRMQTSETFATLREAEDFARVLAAVGAQEAVDRLYSGEQAARVPTLDALARAHIEHIDGAGHGHRVKSQRLWDRTWSPRIGNIRADQITRDDLIKALADLAANGQAPGVGYSAKSLSNQRGLLYGVLERAVDEGHLTKHPGKKLRLPQVTMSLAAFADDDDDTEMVCLTGDQFETLHAAVAEHYRPLVKFLFGTGARWGEVVVLRVGDVDLKSPQRTVRIRRALKWSPDGQYTIGPPKTARSRRTIVIGSEIVDLLRPLVVGRDKADLLFTAPRGGMLAHRTFWSDHWRPAIWRAQHCPEHTDPACRCGTAHPKRCTVHEAPPAPCGCPGTLDQSPRIHDARHTHASWLLANGVPIHVVSARLGHKSIQVTVDTYSHLLPDAQLIAANAAELVFAGPKQIE